MVGIDTEKVFATSSLGFAWGIDGGEQRQSEILRDTVLMPVDYHINGTRLTGAAVSLLSWHL